LKDTVQSLKLLGVSLTTSLSWSEHITADNYVFPEAAQTFWNDFG